MNILLYQSCHCFKICIVFTEQTQPVMPSAPPASVVDQQPHQLDPYPPQPVSDPNTRATTTTDVTTTETVCYLSSLYLGLYALIIFIQRTRERSCCDCCQDVYCPGFIFCFHVPTPCPASCDCDRLPLTIHCNLNNCGDCGGGDDNPLIIIIVLILLAPLLLVALIGIIAFLIYRLVSTSHAINSLNFIIIDV